MEIISIKPGEGYADVTYRLKKPYGIPDKTETVRVEYSSIAGLERISQEELDKRDPRENQKVQLSDIGQTVVISIRSFREKCDSNEEVFDSLSVCV